MFKKYVHFFLNLLVKPGALLSFSKALLRGTIYIVWYRLIRRGRVIIRFPFLCHTKLEISGPGKVFIDRRCVTFINTFDHISIVTLSPGAEVTIGRNCTLGGVTIRCGHRITIGDNLLSAANLIQDVVSCTNFGLVGSDDSGDRRGVVIGNDVWLSGMSIVLQGSTIGNGCVLGLNCLYHNAASVDHCLSIGNPALRPLAISKIQILQNS